MFNKWHQKRKIAAKKEAWQRGFNWAAGQLLEFDNEIYIESKLEYSRDFGDYDTFDKGASDALEKYREVKEMSSQKVLNNIFKHG